MAGMGILYIHMVELVLVMTDDRMLMAIVKMV